MIYEGTKVLGEGAILAGLVFGSIVAFVIDRRFLQAGIAALFGAVLSWIGLIHGEKVEWAANPQVALGYLFVAAVCFAFLALRLEPLDENRDVVLD